MDDIKIRLLMGSSQLGRLSGNLGRSQNAAA
jgi:hypothetical protein